MSEKYIACFLGHREIRETEKLKSEISKIVKKLILEKHVDTFLFGSKSRFDDLCHKILTEYKEKYPHIKRVYVRAEYPEISDEYKEYLLQSYEDTYYPKTVMNSGKACYIKRNFEMIDRSQFCVIYYVNDYTDNGKKSGTKIAFD